jgi:hypothetical protein
MIFMGVFPRYTVLHYRITAHTGTVIGQGKKNSLFILKSASCSEIYKYFYKKGSK